MNPILSIGEQVGEPLRYHLQLSPKDRLKRIVEVLSSLRIPT